VFRDHCLGWAWCLVCIPSILFYISWEFSRETMGRWRWHPSWWVQRWPWWVRRWCVARGYGLHSWRRCCWRQWWLKGAAMVVGWLYADLGFLLWVWATLYCSKHILYLVATLKWVSFSFIPFPREVVAPISHFLTCRKNPSL